MPDPGAGQDQQTLAIELRVVFERGDFCRVSFLPRRADPLPTVLAVDALSGPLRLEMLHEDWYEDVAIHDPVALRHGVVWQARLGNQIVNWSLGGREVFVLARHDDVSGFVTTPRLLLNEEQVVLFSEDRLEDVLSALIACGSDLPNLLRANGVPQGWVLARGVVPTRHVPLPTQVEILNVLRPLPEIRIALEGGIRIGRSIWLNHFPPQIRIRGDVASLEDLRIDGHAAIQSGDAYVTRGWDSPGEHFVSCNAGTRTYSIADGAMTWDPWDTNAWFGRDLPDGIVCGALVLSWAEGDPATAFIASRSNPVLIGRDPGEVVVCHSRTDVHTAACIGFPRFAPIWALPLDPRRCDKRTARVLLIGAPRSPRAGPAHRFPGTAPSEDRALNRDARTWRGLILACSYKQLTTEPDSAGVRALWRQYQTIARRLRGPH